MKVAIVTTHSANNFGAVLQAYSLVMECRELGADAEILDWRCPQYERQYRTAWKMHRNPIPALKYLWWYMTRERRARQHFDDFRKRLPLSRKIVRRSDLLAVAQEYDSFIVGSDQVWNPGNSADDPLKFDRTYLLDFVKDKPKNAYAASIGTRGVEPETLIPEFKTAWMSYAYITMREHAGAQFVSGILKRPIETVLDPVLLHDVEFWRTVANNAVRPKEKYVVVYNVHKWRKGSRWLVDMAHDYATKYHCRIVDLLVPSAREKWSCDSVSVGPAEFLAFIDGAEAVFTNSFHASAFSVIFRKKLYLNRVGDSAYPNSRFNSLMQFAGLCELDRWEKNGDVISMVDCAQAKGDRLVFEIVRSKGFLRQMLGDSKTERS